MPSHGIIIKELLTLTTRACLYEVFLAVLAPLQKVRRKFSDPNMHVFLYMNLVAFSHVITRSQSGLKSLIVFGLFSVILFSTLCNVLLLSGEDMFDIMSGGRKTLMHKFC